MMRIHFAAVSCALLTGWIAASAVTATTLFTTATLAQEVYPNRSIRIVVPTGAGGITDILARIIGTQLSTRLGQPVVIDNRTGASGIFGTEAVAKRRLIPNSKLLMLPCDSYHPAASNPDQCAVATREFIQAHPS